MNETESENVIPSEREKQTHKNYILNNFFFKKEMINKKNYQKKCNEIFCLFYLWIFCSNKMFWRFTILKSQRIQAAIDNDEFNIF